MVPCLTSSLQQSHLQQHHHLHRPTATGRSHPHTSHRKAFRKAHSAAAIACAAPSEAVLVHDGRLVPAPATAQLLLSQHRDWSYTTAAVREQYLVVDWELHLERLIRNIQVLAQQRPPAYADFVQWQQQQGSPADVAAALQHLVNPMVAQALHELQHSHQAADQQQAMLTVALGDMRPAESSRSSASTSEGTPPLSVLVWAKPYVPPVPRAAKVLVAGDPRPAAQAKHADWVVARQPLQQLQQEQGVDEVVLSDSSGALLEGLVSNFYVIADAEQLAACGQPLTAADVYSGSGLQLQNHPMQQPQQQQADYPQQQQPEEDSRQLTGLVLLTTGPSADALLGVTQQRVLQACQQLQLPVVLQPAMSCTAAAWRGFFLSNCLRGLQPIQEVRLSSGVVWDAAAAAGPPAAEGAGVIVQLQREVERLQVETNLQGWLQ